MTTKKIACQLMHSSRAVARGVAISVPSAMPTLPHPRTLQREMNGVKNPYTPWQMLLSVEQTAERTPTCV